ncbi:hypothetical protein CHRY9390_00468 [Chryseobacterium aquaeductus]|uniref:SH3b domain-containing protein n=1 Tax=Chryseobacterium aquaeductus TaxID=2675056 RepID=A0A9N8ME44_9FLAO|nr:SH3 domain-containing protein [Chryseobacterium aquaeductus]CAA7329820.1 hypothetical protein CHRY9390_00468 [Chryseobacterium potabilaquae]CAD7799310.1 hypothetical protein CHRY9390_00468 [Chryseobacterium aquaeductus]
MKSIFVLFAVFMIQIFSAQEEIYANGVFSFEENKTQKIFTDYTRVRALPNTDSQILDSLKTNHSILILQKNEKILMLGERSANWYKISYQKDNKTSEGYIWGGNLAIGTINKNGYDFLFGISKTVDKKDEKFKQTYKQNLAGIKVLEKNRLIDEISFETGSGESLSYGTFITESNHKLQNVDFTLKASVSGEACGIAGYDQYVLFKDKKLIALPQLMNVGDADIYHHSEEFIFPNDKGGMPNAFIFKMEEMEKDENDKEKVKRLSKTYLWNGSSYKIK